jgi:hypothetical protein
LETKTYQQLQAPWPAALPRLRAVPARHEGLLAADFDSLCRANKQAIMQEVQPYAGMTMIAALQAAVVLNQATTNIPLPRSVKIQMQQVTKIRKRKYAAATLLKKKQKMKELTTIKKECRDLP